jgi:hypothetical protein
MVAQRLLLQQALHAVHEAGHYQAAAPGLPPKGQHPGQVQGQEADLLAVDHHLVGWRRRRGWLVCRGVCSSGWCVQQHGISRWLVCGGSIRVSHSGICCCYRCRLVHGSCAHRQSSSSGGSGSGGGSTGDSRC